MGLVKGRPAPHLSMTVHFDRRGLNIGDCPASIERVLTELGKLGVLIKPKSGRALGWAEIFDGQAPFSEGWGRVAGRWSVSVLAAAMGVQSAAFAGPNQNGDNHGKNA